MADETRIVKIEIEAEDNFKKLADLKTAIIDNKNQQAQLKQAYKDGQITLQEFSGEIVRNEANVKKQTDSYNQLQKQVTGVKSPFDKLNESITTLGTKFGAATPALDKMSGGAVSAASGFLDMAKASLAFIATPIGAVIGALGLALGALITYFKSSGDGADKLSFIMAGLKGAFNVIKDLIIGVGRSLSTIFTDPKQALIDFATLIKDNIINRLVGMAEFLPALGKAISLVFKGEFLEAGKIVVDATAKMTLGINNVSDKLIEFGKNVRDEAKASNEMAKAVDALEDRERNYNITASATTLEIQRLTLAAKNRSLTTEEQLKLLDKAANLEKQRAAELTKIRTAQLKQTADEMALRLNLHQQEGESLDAYAARLVNFSGQQGELIDEDKDKIINAIKAVNDARGESLNILEKLKNKEEQVYLKTEQEKLKIQQEADKAHLELQKLRLKNSDGEWKERIEMAKQANDEIAEKAQKEFDNEKKIKDLKVKSEQAMLDLILGKKSVAHALGTALLKKDSLKEVVINTKAAAISAFKSLAGIPIVGPVLGAVAAAAAIAYGATQAAGIAGISFAAGGGSFLTKGPTMLIVGDNPGGVERIDVSPISGRGETKVAGNMIALAGGGTVISDGGYSKNNGVMEVNQSLMIAQALRNMPQQYVSWKEFTELDTRIKVKQAITSL